MSIIGVVDSVWRYPVKSMRGEELDEIIVHRGGVEGDRRFAIGNSTARPDFPYFTGRQRAEMLLFRPRVGEDATATAEVETPSGETFTVDDPQLLQRLAAGVASAETLGLMRSAEPLTDAQPLSIISIQTAAKLANETATLADKRRFRANIYIDLPGTDGFHENTFVGRSLRIGSQVVAAVLERDSRCMMITLDPDTAAKAPAILKQVARAHDGTAGVYATVAAEGVVRKGDPIELI